MSELSVDDMILNSEDSMRVLHIEEIIWDEDATRWLLSLQHSIPYPIDSFLKEIRNFEEDELYMQWSSVYSFLTEYDSSDIMYTNSIYNSSSRLRCN